MPNTRSQLLATSDRLAAVKSLVFASKRFEPSAYKNSVGPEQALRAVSKGLNDLNGLQYFVGARHRYFLRGAFSTSKT
jgi:hypothetical protein